MTSQPVPQGRSHENSLTVPDSPLAITLEFTPVEWDKAARARLTIGTRQEFHFERAAPLKATGAAELAEFVGAYISEELLDARHVVSIAKDAKDGLVVKSLTIPQAALQAMAPDKFMVPGFGLNVEFVRDGGGRISGFAMSVGRAAGILFNK